MSQRKSDGAITSARARVASPSATTDAVLTTTWTTKVLSANAAALALLRTHESRLVDKPLAVFVDLVDRTAFRARLRDVVADGGCRDWRLSLRCADGTTRAVVASVQRRSVDPRCDLQWTLRIDPEAGPSVSRNDVDELVRKLAHDLNQPLAAIVSYARGCQLRVGSNTLKPEDLAMVLEQIVAEALRAGAVIREFSRKEPST